ncbi:beta-ketoacyl-[acyl-carrier-protein] synthase family protein [Amylibacter sp. IMCC11727]|uniref:beta-ketoacyl-[acyl-carrier-protein] synthase family protein n=1 Tax=Amylibacter sp. IMCC11727 TaxID=3039851 RepID=UPI00244E2695|nr:beta-ketoacyl-[acyl-carrier-protein] synthase family protein [Amylibacter sp. IMCC11727]WGI20309.1 beta-ketoacyl-[acyl-carrier-protein] synthase family protein [Amylibacter sp. IMCC11727]
MSNRVVITGQGAICALGLSATTTLDAMLNGRCGIGALDFPDVDRLSVQIGAQIKGFDADARFTRSQQALYDPFTQYALIAAQEAVTQSGLTISDALALETGVVLGSAGGGLQTQDQNYKTVYEDGKNRVHPFVVPRLMMNAASSHVSMAQGAMGPCFTVSTACASSNHAMGQAFQMVRSGAAKVMLTGGSDSMLCFGGIKAWEGLRVLSPDGCRPFCATRNGMVQGEGAAIFVFENLDHATARGANILAEVAGFSMTSDAADIVVPNAQSAARAMAASVKDAGLNPEDIGFVNAHGTATSVNDKTEISALRLAFGAAANDMAVTSTKSMHGHMMGATGAVELLSCVAAVKDGVLAPTINHAEDDPECDLDIIANTSRETPVTAAISNAFAFGGLNAVLTLKRYK